MLEPRLYRVAFVPVLLALLVAAFSLQDRPRPIGTTQAPEAFDEIRADQTLDDLARRFPVRRPGDAADTRLAGEIASRLRQTVPGTVEEHHFQGDTIDGERDLVDVVATRPGVPGPPIVVVAHRDAAKPGSKAELSATAALLELARVAADGRLRRTITFISTSGGSGGFAGAREEARRLARPRRRGPRPRRGRRRADAAAVRRLALQRPRAGADPAPAHGAGRGARRGRHRRRRAARLDAVAADGRAGDDLRAGPVPARRPAGGAAVGLGRAAAGRRRPDPRRAHAALRSRVAARPLRAGQLP